MLMKIVLRFLFFTTLMWFKCNVIQRQVYTESLSSGWGEKTKFSREFLSNIFSMKTIERTLFTSYCLWLTHELSHVSFLIVCSYPIKFFIFSNYLMSLNVLRHVMKFLNSAVFKVEDLLRLDYFYENIILVLHCRCFKISFLYALQKLEKKKAVPSRVIE